MTCAPEIVESAPAARMSQQHRFLLAVRRLQWWYVPATKAQAFTGPTTSSKPGSRIQTKDWKRSIAQEKGSLRRVARLWNVSHSTVSRYRREFGEGESS